jgi:glyoxylase-like metal-dependent hydrolase (beta-lactamase superfamily II)
MPGSAYRIEFVESAPFAENAYVLWRPGGSAALVVDPSFDVGSILAILNREKLEPVAILNTHGHADHIAGNEVMKGRFPDSPLIIGVNDAALLGDTRANLSAGFGMPIVSPPADRTVQHGERLELAGFAFEVREIPGHSPGSVVYACLEDFEPGFVLGGDVLFAGSVGRTDLEYGDGPLLFAGIKAKLFDLPDATRVYPGHGPMTTIGRERATNPFVGG